MNEINCENVLMAQMAEIDGEDGCHDKPGRDMLAEQLDPDHLARAAVDGGAHQHGLRDGQPVVDRDRPEQQGEGQRRDDDRKAEPRAFKEFMAAGASKHPLLS